MPDGERDPAAMLPMLTTEHFTLAGARGNATAESASRSALYLGSLSSALIGLGFVAQISEAGDLFRVFALVALPTIYLLGIFTFVRLVENSIEDIYYGRAINRIRHFYIEQAGADARYFMLSGYDDAAGVIANMALRPSRWQLYFTASAMVAVVNSVVGGTAVGLAVGIAFEPALGVSVAAGAVFAAASLALHMRSDRARHERGAAIDPLFPSPADASAAGRHTLPGG
jgi:hypothetical protein